MIIYVNFPTWFGVFWSVFTQFLEKGNFLQFSEYSAPKITVSAHFAHNYYSNPALFVRTYLGVVLEREWRSRVNKVEITLFGTQRLALIRFLVLIEKSTQPKAWQNFSKYTLYHVCTRKRLRISGPWKNTKLYCNSLSIFTIVDLNWSFKMIYET